MNINPIYRAQITVPNQGSASLGITDDKNTFLDWAKTQGYDVDKITFVRDYSFEKDY